jgi:hypothetical protein
LRMLKSSEVFLADTLRSAEPFGAVAE